MFHVNHFYYNKRKRDDGNGIDEKANKIIFNYNFNSKHLSNARICDGIQFPKFHQ